MFFNFEARTASKRCKLHRILKLQLKYRNSSLLFKNKKLFSLCSNEVQLKYRNSSLRTLKIYPKNKDNVGLHQRLDEALWNGTVMPSFETELVMFLSRLFFSDFFNGKHELLCNNAYMHKHKQYIVTYFTIW